MIDRPIVDVAIIGGGPAGSSLASYLAMAGVKCVVFEGEVFPRPHVGESLVPASTRVFKEIGFLDKMEEAGFPHKYGAAWTTVMGDREYDHDWEGLSPDTQVDIRFEERAQESTDRNYTYHVDRGKFDLMLLRHAEELGAAVHEGTRVQSIKFSDNGGLHTVKSVKDDRSSEIQARLVVDASGRRTLLGNQLKLKVTDPVFDQYAIHTWFEGFDREVVSGKKRDFIFIHFLPVTNSWIWQIPITDEITSIGVVTQKKNFARSKSDREKFFWDTVASRPEIEAELRRAIQLRPLTPEGDYSYAMKQLAGDGWLLIGDAARFVDPIFSSGVSIALNSARFASQDIFEALRSGDFTRESFQRYETLQNRGAKNWYEFITLYYRLNVLFTAFISNPKYRLDVLQLLQGDVYDEDEPAVLEEMRRIVTGVEQNPNHIWHKLLGDLTAGAYKPAGM
jgi:flavin-dependent dehydrogenase